VPIDNIGGFLVARIDGQSWVLNPDIYYSSFSQLAGYSSCYNLPSGGSLCWKEVTGSENPYYPDFPYAYCYNYNGTDYTFGNSNKNHVRSFFNLRKQTKVSDNEKSYYLKYVFRRFGNEWYPQYQKSASKKRGIFWAELKHDVAEGWYVVMKRSLIETGSDIMYGDEVWSPSLHFPAYYRNNIFNYLDEITGVVSPLTEVMEKLYIDRYNEEVTFMLKWPGSDLDLTLVTPNGTVIDPELAYLDPDIDYVETETYEFYRVFEPEAGQWQAKVKAVDVDGEEPYTLEVFGRASDIQPIPTELTLDFPLSVQYSDMLSGSATLTSEEKPLEGKEVEFGCMLPVEKITTDENGIAFSTEYKVKEASGESQSPICVNFYGDDRYLPSYSEKHIEIEKENATLTYTGDTITEVGSSTALSCNVSQEDDGYPGDITLSGPVTFTLTTEEGFSETYTADINTDGIATMDIELSVGLYSVVASIDSDYYILDESSEETLAVYDPRGPFITGGGWFIPGGKEDKVNFGFEVKYKKDGTLKGNLKVTDHNTGTEYSAVGFNYMVIVEGKAYISGNLSIDEEGGHPFTAVIEDSGSPGSGSDRFSIDFEVDGENIVFDEIIGSGSIVIHK
jgi:hypothetical protein